MLLLIVILSAVLVFIAVSSLLTFLAKGELGMDSRIQRYTEIKRDVAQSMAAGTGQNQSKGSSKANQSKSIRRLVRFLGSKLKKVPQAKDFDIKMQQAGLPLFGGEFLVVLAGSLLLMFVMALLFTHDVVMSLLVAIVLAVMILMYVDIRISRRRQSFNNQLGDALVMMANSMRSGFSFMQAVDMVANEMSAPISVEFAKLVGEMRLGIPTDEALGNISKRIGSKDFDLVIIAVIIHRQVGGNLSQILESISTTITDRIKMKREISTLTAQGRMSGWIVGALPLGMGLAMHLINPNYLVPMFTNPLGQMAIGVALISQAIGAFCIKQIVDIET